MPLARYQNAAAWLLLSTGAIAAPVQGQTTPNAFQSVMNCQTIRDNVQRLACFDEKVAALDSAQKSKDVYVADKVEVQKTRRGLFGLSLPSLDIFGGGNDKGESVEEIESVVKSVQRSPYGAWTLELEDGAKWQQIDTRPLARYPRAGSQMRIRKAAAGSFLANIDGQTAIRVRRVL